VLHTVCHRFNIYTGKLCCVGGIWRGNGHRKLVTRFGVIRQVEWRVGTEKGDFYLHYNDYFIHNMYADVWGRGTSVSVPIWTLLPSSSRSQYRYACFIIPVASTAMWCITYLVRTHIHRNMISDARSHGTILSVLYQQDMRAGMGNDPSDIDT